VGEEANPDMARREQGVQASLGGGDQVHERRKQSENICSIILPQTGLRMGKKSHV
jgi:hypothetical protein